MPELAPSIGSARASVQQMVGFARRDQDVTAVSETAQRRFGRLGSSLVCGAAATLTEHFRMLEFQGAQRFYVWFADFAEPASIAEFAETVIGARGTNS